MTDPISYESLLPKERRINLGGLLGTLGPVLALFVILVVTAILERYLTGGDRFLTLENQMNIIRQMSFVGIVALGMTFVIISGGIDLSVGSIVAFAGGLGIWTMNSAMNARAILSRNAKARAEHASDAAMGLNLPLELPFGTFTESLAKLWTNLGIAVTDAHAAAGPKVLAAATSSAEMKAVWLAVGVTLLAGVLAGLVNGLLVAKGRLAPFIATIGGFAAYRSLALALADGGEYRSGSTKLYGYIGSKGIDVPWIELAPNRVLTIPWSVLIFLGLAVVLSIVLNRTRYGRYVFAVGNNERAARYSAINVDRIKIITYTLIGGTCGIAALLLGSRMNSVASSTTGQQYELDAIAAVVIGGTRMTGGAGSIFGTVVGVLILGEIGNMLNFLQVSPYLQGLVKGVIIIAAVLVQRVGRRTA
jgi:ribose transport system permease protein